MAIKPLNSMLKENFEYLFQMANERAVSDFNENIKVKLNGQDHYTSFKLLVEEKLRIDKIISTHEHPYYISNHSSESWLLSQFAGRTILLNVDESKELAESVYLGQYSYLVNDFKRTLKEEIPAYSFNDFLDGKECKYFFSFDNYYNINEEDYYKIREWQALNLIKIVAYEYRLLVKKIQTHCKTLSDPLGFIILEKEKIENILDKAPDDPKLVKSILSDLFIFSGMDTALFDDVLLIRNFQPYKTGEIDWKCISPTSINIPLKLLEANPENIFSNEATVFYTINKVTNWLDSVIRGKPIQEPIVAPNWKELLQNCQADALQQAESIMTEIDENVYGKDLTKDEIKIYLCEQLEIYRRKFNAFDEKYFFHVLRDEKKYLLERMFITNSFFSNDIDSQVTAITESTIIHEVSWHIAYTYGDIFDTHRLEFPGGNDGYLEIMSLMNEMVIDKELHTDMRQSMDDFMNHFHSYFLPIEMHFQNQREKLGELFVKSLNRLQKCLDDADPSKKIIYLQSRIKELRHNENYLKRHKHEGWFDEREFKYDRLFKEFLSIEADFVKETRDIDISFVLPQTNTVLLSSPPPSTFDALLPGGKGAFVLQMLEDLGITVNNKSAISERRKGALRGVVEALKARDILPNQSLEVLNNLVGEKIGLVLKSKIDWSKTSDAYLAKGKKYIADNYNR